MSEFNIRQLVQRSNSIDCSTYVDATGESEFALARSHIRQLTIFRFGRPAVAEYSRVPAEISRRTAVCLCALRAHPSLTLGCSLRLGADRLRSGLATGRLARIQEELDSRRSHAARTGLGDGDAVAFVSLASPILVGTTGPRPSRLPAFPPSRRPAGPPALIRFAGPAGRRAGSRSGDGDLR